MDRAVRQRVTDLAFDHPDWLPVLEAACAVSKQTEPDGVFAGRWVLLQYAQLNEMTAAQSWQPGLRRLVAYGLIEKVGPSTRGGRRAYYRMPQRKEVEAALADLRS